MVDSSTAESAVARGRSGEDEQRDHDAGAGEGAEAAGASAAIEGRFFAEGGAGAVDLAEALVQVTEGEAPQVSYLYPEDASIEEKVHALATNTYGADGVQWSPTARRQVRNFEGLGWGKLPVCMAKTHLSLSHNPRLRGRPRDYIFEVSDARASAGAGFIYPIAGNMTTLPGLPGSPRVLDVDDAGNILGL